MNPLQIAYDFNQPCFRKDAVLLAMLPYCAISYDALSIMFDDACVRRHCVQRLQEQGLIEPKTLHYHSSYRSFDYKYITLTTDGLLYLASIYSDLYPWLAYYSEIRVDTITAKGKASVDTLYRQLLRQATNLFWAIAGAETVYARMSTQPSAVSDALFYRSNSRLWTPYTIANLMKDHPVPSTNQMEATDLIFFDSVEAHALMAQTAASNVQDESDAVVKDQSMFQSNHSGLLVRGDNQKYMVFTSMKHGIHWSGTPIVRNRKQLGAQFKAVNPRISSDIPGNGFHAFLICNSHHEMKHSFTNSRRQWAKRTSFLGQGVSSLSLLPYDDNGITLAQYILNSDHYNTDVSYLLCKTNPDLIYNGLDLRAPIRTKDETFVPCFDMDAVRLRYAKERLNNIGRANVICWDWQVPFISEMLPEATMYSVASATGELSKAGTNVRWKP